MDVSPAPSPSGVEPPAPPQPPPCGGASRVRIRDVNDTITCVLCGGYFVDATTIVECLHSFCKSCIVRYLELSHYCPVCDVLVHKTRPHTMLRPDHVLQDLVYKLVPGLFSRELSLRREFVRKYADKAAAAAATSSERHLLPHNEDSDSGASSGHSAHHLILEDDKISLVLEHSPDGKPVIDYGRDEAAVSVFPGRRYLLAPARVTVSIIKRFVRLKLGLPERGGRLAVDVFHTDEPLDDAYTLMDVAYIYTWQRTGPLRLFYCIYEPLPAPPLPAPPRAPASPAPPVYARTFWDDSDVYEPGPEHGTTSPSLAGGSGGESESGESDPDYSPTRPVPADVWTRRPRHAPRHSPPSTGFEPAFVGFQPLNLPTYSRLVGGGSKRPLHATSFSSKYASPKKRQKREIKPMMRKIRQRERQQASDREQEMKDRKREERQERQRKEQQERQREERQERQREGRQETEARRVTERRNAVDMTTPPKPNLPALMTPAPAVIVKTESTRDEAGTYTSSSPLSTSSPTSTDYSSSSSSSSPQPQEGLRGHQQGQGGHQEGHGGHQEGHERHQEEPVPAGQKRAHSPDRMENGPRIKRSASCDSLTSSSSESTLPFSSPASAPRGDPPSSPLNTSISSASTGKSPHASPQPGSVSSNGKSPQSSPGTGSVCSGSSSSTSAAQSSPSAGSVSSRMSSPGAGSVSSGRSTYASPGTGSVASEKSGSSSSSCGSRRCVSYSGGSDSSGYYPVIRSLPVSINFQKAKVKIKALSRLSASQRELLSRPASPPPSSLTAAPRPSLTVSLPRSALSAAASRTNTSSAGMSRPCSSLNAAKTASVPSDPADVSKLTTTSASGFAAGSPIGNTASKSKTTSSTCVDAAAAAAGLHITTTTTCSKRRLVETPATDKTLEERRSSVTESQNGNTSYAPAKQESAISTTTSESSELKRLPCTQNSSSKSLPQQIKQEKATSSAQVKKTSDSITSNRAEPVQLLTKIKEDKDSSDDEICITKVVPSSASAKPPSSKLNKSAPSAPRMTSSPKERKQLSQSSQALVPPVFPKESSPILPISTDEPRKPSCGRKSCGSPLMPCIHSYLGVQTTRKEMVQQPKHCSKPKETPDAVSTFVSKEKACPKETPNTTLVSTFVPTKEKPSPKPLLEAPSLSEILASKNNVKENLKLAIKSLVTPVKTAPAKDRAIKQEPKDTKEEDINNNGTSSVSSNENTSLPQMKIEPNSGAYSSSDAPTNTTSEPMQVSNSTSSQSDPIRTLASQRSSFITKAAAKALNFSAMKANISTPPPNVRSTVTSNVQTTSSALMSSSPSSSDSDGDGGCARTSGLRPHRLTDTVYDKVRDTCDTSKARADTHTRVANVKNEDQLTHAATTTASGGRDKSAMNATHTHTKAHAATHDRHMSPAVGQKLPSPAETASVGPRDVKPAPETLARLLRAS